MSCAARQSGSFCLYHLTINAARARLVCKHAHIGAALYAKDAIGGYLSTGGLKRRIGSSCRELLELPLVQNFDRAPAELDQTARLKLVERQGDRLAVGSDHVRQLLMAGVDRPIL